MKCVICNKEFTGLICLNKYCGEIYNECGICNKVIASSSSYEYRGFIACLEDFEELQNKVNYKREQVMETVEATTKSQIAGEWNNGGYKTMKVDSGGNPITKIKSPQILEDYEKGIL